MIRLGDIVEVSNGYAFKSSNYVADGVRVVRIANVQKGYISDESPKFYPLDSMDEHNRYLIREGDILMSLTGNVGRVGVFPAELLPAFLNQRVARLRPKSSIDEHYLFHLLNSDEFERKATWNSSGVAQLNLSSKWVEDYMFELPPLEEQKRIAGILDEADRVRKKTQALIDKYDELAQSLFLDMFGDPVTNPKGWEVKPLEMLAKVIRGSSPRPAGDPRYFNGSVPRLMVSDLTRDGMFVRAMTDSLTVEGAAKSRPMKKGQLVMAVSGNPGLPAILAEDCCIHDGFAGFRDLSSDFDPRFLYFHFRLVQKATASQADGAIFQNITTNTIRNLSIPVVPMQLQQKFINDVGLINDQKELVQSGFEPQLFNALLQKAFKGELS